MVQRPVNSGSSPQVATRVLPLMGSTLCFSFISNSFEFSTNCLALSMARLRARVTLLWSRICSPICHRISNAATISSAIPARKHSVANAITARLRSPWYFSAMPVPSWPSSIHLAPSPTNRGSSGSRFSNSSVAAKWLLVSRTILVRLALGVDLVDRHIDVE